MAWTAGCADDADGVGGLVEQTVGSLGSTRAHTYGGRRLRCRIPARGRVRVRNLAPLGHGDHHDDHRSIRFHHAPRPGARHQRGGFRGLVRTGGRYDRQCAAGVRRRSVHDPARGGEHAGGSGYRLAGDRDGRRGRDPDLRTGRPGRLAVRHRRGQRPASNPGTGGLRGGCRLRGHRDRGGHQRGGVPASSSQSASSTSPNPRGDPLRPSSQPHR